MIQDFEYIKKKIDLSDNILLSTHENPDCDGLGSEIAIYYYAKSLNKNCRIINCSQMSSKYRFIDPDDIIEVYSNSQDEWLSSIDLAVIFDIGSHKRLRDISPLIESCPDKISIDHHLSDNQNYFSMELIDELSPATGAIVWDFLNYANSEILNDIKVSNALYASIVTDTGSFRYSNTSPKTHRIAASLLKNGVEPNEIYQNIYENRTKSQIALLSHVINNVKYAVSNEVAYIVLFKTDFENYNASLSENDGMADFLRSIEDVEISFVITQIEDDIYKINFRSRKKYVINDIAGKFNGGGHALASGATVHTSNVNELTDEIIFHLKERIVNGN